VSSPGSLPTILLGLFLASAGMLMLIFFLRRSHRDEDERLVLDVDPDVGAAAVIAPPVVASPSPIAEDLAPIDEDAPLKNARKAPAKRAPRTAPVATAAVISARTFAKPPRKGVERAKVGYRRVRISSIPDAVRSAELGRLDRGDEVEILDASEGFLRIRTPDDITGWILRHTIVGAPAR
jgi:hypothetical protein